jgi:23S rRNA-/tRNA-specific pseudouridylate synthase
MTTDPAGQPALTRFSVLARAGDGSRALLRLEPVTGRTHQLRVHCAAAGFPIVGDALYGGAPRGSRLMLHAWRVSVPMQASKPPGAGRGAASGAAGERGGGAGVGGRKLDRLGLNSLGERE